MLDATPFYPLTRAIKYLERFANHNPLHPPTLPELADIMGFNSLHGAALATIKSMGIYGLIIVSPEEPERTAIISPLGNRVLEDDIEALETAALRPPLFKNLAIQRFPGHHQDKKKLMLELQAIGWSYDTANRRISSYLETMSLLEARKSGLARSYKDFFIQLL